MKKLNTFSIIIIVFFSLFIPVLITFRNHFLFGTALIVGKWIFILLAFYFLRLSSKRDSPRWLKQSLYFTTFFLIAEIGVSYFQSYSLDSNSSEKEVSLMSYNLFFKNRSPNQIIQLIKRHNPDILVVQELTPKWKIQLNNSIGSIYQFKRLKSLRGTHGLGIYSKYPIIKSRYIPKKSRPFAQVVELNIDTKKIQIINTHLASPAIAVENPDRFLSLFKKNTQQRTEQFETINAEIDNNKFNAQIIIGDLNTTVYEPLYRNIQNEWSDLNSTDGSMFNFNFPNTRKLGPIIMLDYIFLRGNVNGEDFKVIQGGSSDHLAILGKVKI